jgi:hypothetical protein
MMLGRMQRPLIGSVLAAALLAISPGAGSATAAQGPFTSANGGTTAGGYPLAGSSPTGITIRFIDKGNFWVAVLLKNSSSSTVTLLDATTPEPQNSLIAQAQGTWAPFTPCADTRLACPFPAPKPPPTTTPLTVAPGHHVAVKLSYHLVPCASAASATTASGDILTVAYRNADGTTGTQELPLTGARLHLLRPAGEDCLPRPESHIGLVGSFTTSPGHKPMPGSTGDTCTRTPTGGLSFESRMFFDRNQVMFRISIRLPHFHGPGSYGDHNGALGSATVTATGGFGLHSWTLFTDRNGSVTVSTDEGTTLGGRFNAVFSGHRRFFRGYGAWRCTTRKPSR